ncbi:MAG TPA: DEAD/DEAH box helicase [Thermoleophilaceae bacterium]|nr:DEAD/DEAH box helicase [Thermoleophilaceae bacterium]
MQKQSFADLGASGAVVDALGEMGIDAPFQVQRIVVPDVRAGRDVLVKSPTGSGKTLAFGVPIVDNLEATDPRPSALVVVPTRELAGQIVDDLRTLAHARALSIAAVYGGAGIERQSKLARRAHILVATPGRLEDLMARGAVKLDRVRILVLDEADRMLDMGFRPAVDRIVGALPRERQTLFFSATLDGTVMGVAKVYTRDARRHEHSPPSERRADVKHRFVAVRRESKLDALVGELRGDDAERNLVFVRTKHGADRLVKRLRARDVEALAMHGNKTQSQRERALARFAAGDVSTLVATDVAARGLDIDHVGHVINFDPPADGDGYVHRVGRTGRAGRSGRGTTFVTHEDARDVRQIAHGLRLHAEFAQAGLGERRAHNRGGAQSADRSGRRRSRSRSRGRR